MIFCSAFFRREDYNKTQGYNSNMNDGYEDWDFWLTLLQKEDRVERIDKIHFFYRKKETSMVELLEGVKQDRLLFQLFKNHQQIYLQYLNPVKDYRWRFLNDLEENNRYQRKKSKKYKRLYNIMLIVSLLLLLLVILETMFFFIYHCRQFAYE
jgi:hypothetical protein